jgi:hypothetical protein
MLREYDALVAYDPGGSMYTTTKKTASRPLVLVVMVATMVLAGIAIVAAEAQAGSFSDGFPKQVLMKGTTVLQEGNFYYGSWHWYEAGEWNRVDADGILDYPRADTVRAGSKLHIKINKPERPAAFRIRAYKKVDRFSNPIGTGRLLNTTFRRVERDGETVGWNVFFRVNEPNRNYYLKTYGRWARVPGTHISYGDESRLYHLKTTE